MVEYYKPVKIWVENNFYILGNANEGQIYIDDFAHSKTAPVHYTAGAGNNVNLKAIENQIDIDNHERDWNNNLSLNFQSEWKKYNLQTPVFIDNNKNIQYTIANIPETDENMRYEANLRKHFKMYRNKQTEFDGTQYDGIQSEIFEQNNGSLTTPTDVTINGKNYKYAGWTDNTTLPQTRTINNPTDNQTYTALYKTLHKSNQTNAYSNSSQRKFIETLNPDLNLRTYHLVYESMGHVWYETSTNGGSTWILMNAGKPLDVNGGKLPSIDFNYREDYTQNIADKVVIVWQENINGYGHLKLAVFYNDGGVNPSFQKTFETYIIGLDQSYYAKLYSSNTNPVVSWQDDANDNRLLVVWQGNVEGAFGPIERLVYKCGRLGSSGVTWENSIPLTISTTNFTTDNNSVNPTICNYKESSDGYVWHVAWEQIVNSSISKIYYSKLQWDLLNNYLTIGTIEEASLNSGYSKNSKPIVNVRKVSSWEYVYVTWLGYRTSPSVQTRVLMRYKYTNWSVVGAYGGNSVQNFGINKGTTISSNQEIMGLSWSEPNTPGTYYNKLIKSPGGTILTLNTTGKDVQVNNGVNFNDMFVNSFSSYASPYAFNLSQNFGAIGKENSLSIFNGREGIVGKNGAQFFFALGDISVNGQNINFIPVPDSVSISSLQTLNTYFESEPFAVNSNSNLIYGVQYGITDSVLCSSALAENENIGFRVELIDATTNEILGVYDEVTYTAQNIFQYNNIGYEVNLSGIGERIVKFILVTNTNAEFSYGLANRFADQSLLAKNVNQTVNYQGSLAVTDYALEQNYPNPFNPSTTIKFQLPNDGMVTLKVYDILGNEITTLINEQKPQGRYEVNFNASSLASGVYIYKIQAGDFISSKKMLLLK